LTSVAFFFTTTEVLWPSRYQKVGHCGGLIPRMYRRRSSSIGSCSSSSKSDEEAVEEEEEEEQQHWGNLIIVVQPSVAIIIGSFLPCLDSGPTR